MHNAHQVVQKFSKIIINGSILNTKFAAKRLDKNKHFQKKKSKNCGKNFGWAVKKWSIRHYLSFFWQDKITKDKKDAQGLSFLQTKFFITVKKNSKRGKKNY